MLTCPDCNTELVKTPLSTEASRSWFSKLLSPTKESAYHFACESCDGRAVSPTQLCELASKDYVLEIWKIAKDGSWLEKRACPSCAKLMKEVLITHQGLFLPIDICHRCELIWFDHLECERISGISEYLSREERLEQLESSPKNYIRRVKILGEERPAYESSYLGNLYVRQEEEPPKAPSESWKYLTVIFGLPTEWDYIPTRKPPVVTWLLCLLIGSVSYYQFQQPDAFTLRFGLVPENAWKDYGVAILTSFFLHGGWLHLLSNLYFLFNFGDDVEEYLGKLRFVLLIFLGVLLGVSADLLLRQNTSIPSVGASHGVSAVLAFYAFSFPYRRVGIRVLHLPMAVSARVAFLLWLSLQFVGIFIGIFGQTSVGYAAHLGGVAAGCVCGLLWREPRV